MSRPAITELPFAAQYCDKHFLRIWSGQIGTGPMFLSAELLPFVFDLPFVFEIGSDGVDAGVIRFNPVPSVNFTERF